MEMVRRSGQQGVPVIATADEVIVGFDEPRLKRMIQRVSGPKRQPLGVLGADAADYLRRHPEAGGGAPEGTTGVFAGDIRPGSVAEQAGLRKGDIIVGCAGKRVKDMASLDALISTVKPGGQIGIRFIRQGEEQMATLQF